jgi:hypothetical protein
MTSQKRPSCAILCHAYVTAGFRLAVRRFASLTSPVLNQGDNCPWSSIWPEPSPVFADTETDVETGIGTIGLPEMKQPSAWRQLVLLFSRTLDPNADSAT